MSVLSGRNTRRREFDPPLRLHRLSVDAFLGTGIGHTETAKDPKSYVRKLRGRMQYAYKAAAQEINKNAAQNKARYAFKVILIKKIATF